MADANCSIHNTPLNGFGTFTFCNACDIENSHQELYETDKESSFVDAVLKDEANIVGDHSNLLKDTTKISNIFSSKQRYGWLSFQKQLKIGQKGNYLLRTGEIIKLDEPKYTCTAIYRVNLRHIITIPHIKRQVRVLNDITVYLKQIVYNRNSRITIGGVDVGSWNMSNP